MAHQLNDLLSFLGFITWGDIGPLTVYRNKRGRMVAYPKAPPTSPASPAQKMDRDLWREAAEEWQLLEPATRRNWEEASKRASLNITGYNLWIYWYCTCDRPSIETIERQTNLDLLTDAGLPVCCNPDRCPVEDSSSS